MLYRLRDGDTAEFMTIAGFLPHFKYSEKMVNKIIECRECWKERMIDRNGEVKEALLLVIQNIKKGIGVSKELKTKADELAKVISDLIGQPNQPGSGGNASAPSSAQKAEFVKVSSSNKKRRLKR